MNSNEIVEEKLFNQQIYLFKKDLFLLLALEAEYITHQQCVNFGFTSPNTGNRMLTQLTSDGLLRSTTFIEGMNYKSYYLTKKGFSHLLLLLPEEYMKMKSEEFKETIKPPKQMAHKVSVNDVYLALLTNPNIKNVVWKNEKDSIIYKPNTKANSEETDQIILFRNDARFIADGKEFWVEQDMGTEAISQLKTKANQISSYIIDKVNDEKFILPSILFPVNLEFKLPNSLKSKYYKSLDPLKFKIKVLKSIIKDMKAYNLLDFNDCEEGSSRFNLLDFKVRIDQILGNAYIDKKQLNELTDKRNLLQELISKDILNLDDVKLYLKQLEEEFKSKKKLIINEVYERMYNNRMKAIQEALISSQDSNSLYYLLLNGMDTYLVKNADLKKFIQDIYGKEPLVRKVCNMFISRTFERALYDSAKIVKDEIVNIRVGYDRLLVKNVFKFINEKLDIELNIAIEDICYNVGAKVRVEKLLEKCNADVELLLICVVKNNEEAKKLNVKYKIDRLFEKEGVTRGHQKGSFGVYFTNYNELGRFYITLDDDYFYINN